MKESVFRTLVPIIYALLWRLGFADWLGIDNEVMQSLAALIVTGLLYVGVRLLERMNEKWGWLLGSPKQPVYVPTNDARVQVEQKVEEGL